MNNYERAEKFGGKAAGIETARRILASLVLGRGFNQSFEDYLSENPKAAKVHADALAYLAQNGAA